MEIERFSPGPRMSRAVRCGGLLFTAGQVDIAGTDATTQTTNILARIDELLAQAGSNRANLISANIWLANMDDFEAMNAVWDRWIDPENPPARATVQSRLAKPEYIVEIAVVAAVPGR